MESQGNRWRGKWTSDVSGTQAKPARHPRWSTRVDALMRGLLWGAMLWVGAAQAQSNSYTYDANGRLVAVTQNNGASAQYSFDMVGNLVQITSVPAGQLAIFAFSPTHGVAGTQVVIAGKGFSPSPSGNTVSFNGTSAPIVSASSAQLTVTVPTGAMTGPIGVSVGSAATSTATPFVVDSTGLPPTIGAVSPSAVAVGDTLTVTGAHLAPVAGQTVVSLGGRNVSALSSISDGQIQHAVTASDTSGYVGVGTPYGQAASAAPIIVLPAGVSAASIGATAYATNGGSATLNIGSAHQVGAVLFNGNTDDWVSLQLSAMTTQASNINYAVYAPSNQLIMKGTVSSSSPSIHLPKLLVGGTYLATFTPDTTGAQLTVGFESAAVLALGTPMTVATAMPGQSKRVLFQATTQQMLTLSVSNTQTNPSGQAISYTIYNPGQGTYISTSSAGNGSIDLTNLPNSGTYQMVIAPGASTTVTEQIVIQPYQLPTPGQSQYYGGYFAGQNATFAFTANQGDNLELTVSGMSITGSTSIPATVNVYDANGVYVSGGRDCYQGWTCRYPLWNLTAGKYTVVVSPPDANSSIGFNLMLAPDGVGQTLPANTPATVNLSLGQVARLTFNANAGDSAMLQVSNASAQSGSLPVIVSIYRPDTGAITTGNYYATASVYGSNTINLPNLPASGSYTVVVSTSGVPGTAQLKFTPIAAQSIVANGSNQTYNTGGSGQYVLLTFNANSGDNLELTLSGVVAAGNTNAVSVDVYSANGTKISSNTGCYQAWTCRYPLWNLAAGTYWVVVSPPSQTSSVGFNAMLTPDINGPALVAGTPTSVSLGLGQVERLTFSGTAGGTATLNLSQVSTTSPSGLSMYVNVYRPDVGVITATNYYSTFSTTSTNALTLSNLPVSGTYTVVVSTSGVIGSGTLELMPP